MFLKLAWRNIWRNKRRTLITLASVFFAVILSTLLMSIKEGFYDNMIESMVGDYMGYAQIHGNGYWDDKKLEHSFEWSDSIQNVLESEEGLAGFNPRLESFALSASLEITKGAMVVGVDPDKEKKYNALDKRVSEGEYFSAGDRSVLVGDGLAEFLKIGTGDTLVLLGQGYHSVNAAGKYPVQGIVKFGSPDLSKQLVFLPLKESQWLYNMEGRLTHIVLHPADRDNTERLVSSLRNVLDEAYEVMGWKELAPEMVRMINTDRMEGYVFMFILYMVIGFGLFGTVLMMIAERMHEFGIMVAVGMKRWQLAGMVFLEILIISLLGAFIGMLGAFPICAYFHLNPISLGRELSEMAEEYGFEFVLQASIDPGIFLQQASVIFLIACIIAIYPVVRLMALEAINAMRV